MQSNRKRRLVRSFAQINSSRLLAPGKNDRGSMYGEGLAYVYSGSFEDKWISGKNTEIREHSIYFMHVGEWMEGSIVKVELNCEKNTISFWKDGKHLGTVDIEENRTWYPAMAMRCDQNSDFKLMSAV